MAIITDVKALAEDLKDGQEFQVTIDDSIMTFRPVRACPAVSKDVYGRKRVCRGVWYDYGSSRYPDGVVYRFCPKTVDSLGVLNSRLWEDINRQVGYARKERESRDEASAKRRRIDAAVKFCDGFVSEQLEGTSLRQMVEALRMGRHATRGWHSSQNAERENATRDAHAIITPLLSKFEASERNSS